MSLFTIFPLCVASLGPVYLLLPLPPNVTRLIMEMSALLFSCNFFSHAVAWFYGLIWFSLICSSLWKFESDLLINSYSLCSWYELLCWNAIMKFFFFLNQRSKKHTSSYLVLARNTECRWSVCPRCPYSVLHVMFWHLSNRLITSISLGKSDIPHVPHFISWLSLGWLLLMMCYFCVLTLPDSDLMAWKSGVYLVRPVSTQNFNFDARTILTGWISPPALCSFCRSVDCSQCSMCNMPHF